MSESDRPLPTPPRSRFGRDSQEEPAPPGHDFRPDGPRCRGRAPRGIPAARNPRGRSRRNLAMMMMGMSGMMPMEMPAGLPRHPPTARHLRRPVRTPPSPRTSRPRCLRPSSRETWPTSWGSSAPSTRNDPALPTPVDERRRLRGLSAAAAGLRVQQRCPPPGGPGRHDAAIIEELIRISADNDVTVEWLMFRAVKLYVEEYRKTGRLEPEILFAPDLAGEHTWRRGGAEGRSPAAQRSEHDGGPQRQDPAART